jgi:hypothetical protein
MEAIIAIGATVTVIGAVCAILYKVGVGNREMQKLDALKAKIEASNAAQPASPAAPSKSRK